MVPHCFSSINNSSETIFFFSGTAFSLYFTLHLARILPSRLCSLFVLVYMLHHLPSELVADIASHLPAVSLCEVAQTCSHCYFAVLPAMYRQVTFKTVQDIQRFTDCLHGNNESPWSHHARQFVRNVSIGKANDRLYSQYLIQEFLLSGWERLELEAEKRNASMAELFTLFPNLSSMVLDYEHVCGVPPPKQQHPNFRRGKVTLFHYRPGCSESLFQLLTPFNNCRKLALRSRPYISLCATLQDSLLTDKDIATLADIGFREIRHLSLSYVDDTTSLDEFEKLLRSMPKLQVLELEWILPPSVSYYDDLCHRVRQVSSIAPGTLTRLDRTYRLSFHHCDSSIDSLTRNFGHLAC